MKKLITLFLLLLCVVVSAQKKKTASDARFVGLDAQLSQFLTDWHIVGFAVVVVEKDKIVYSKGFGYRDVDKKLPVDGNTLFAIASCSKAFTATLIGQLVNEGKLDLDKPVTSYYPNLKFYTDNMNNIITARDMLSHKTGLPRHDYSWYFFPSDSRDSLVKRIQFMEPTATVREKWQYNNFMFLALGEIDEQLSGKTWETNIKEKIFAPLGMTRSNLTIKDLAADPNASLGYGLKKDSILKKMDYYNISGSGPAGAINSSVNEMANWVTAWINDGKSFATRPFRPKSEVITGYAAYGSPEEQQTYDRLDDIFRTGKLQKYNVGISGGDAKTNFYLSLGYQNQESVLKLEDFERYSFQVNLDHAISNKVKIGTSNSLSKVNRQVVQVGDGPAGFFRLLCTRQHFTRFTMPMALITNQSLSITTLPFSKIRTTMLTASAA